MKPKPIFFLNFRPNRNSDWVETSAFERLCDARAEAKKSSAPSFIIRQSGKGRNSFVEYLNNFNPSGAEVNRIKKLVNWKEGK